LTPQEVRDRLLPDLRGIWPKLSLTEDQIVVIAGVFRNAEVDSVYAAAVAWATDNPDSWPQWKGIAGYLDTGGSYNPAAWTAADEVDLAHTMEIFRRLHARGKLDDERCLDEMHVARTQLGKTPSEQERRDAWAALNKHVRDFNDRQRSRGLSRRLTEWPQCAAYYEKGMEAKPIDKDRVARLLERIGAKRKTRRDVATVGDVLRTTIAWK